MNSETVLVASTVAYSLLVAETIYSYAMYVLKHSKKHEQRFINSVAIFIIVAPLLTINIVEFVTNLTGVHPLLFSLDLLDDFAAKAQQAADRTIDAALKTSVSIANSQTVVQTATIIASFFLGIGAMVVGTAANVGIGAIKGVADVALKVAQVLHAVGTLYKITYEVAKYARLITPLGLALLVSRRARPIGALITALGIGFGYIMPFALNSIAYQVQGVTISLGNMTGVPSVMCVHVESGGPLVNGTWVTAGFPAVVEYQDLDRPGRVVVHPVGCYTELTGKYRVTRVFVGAEPIKVNYTFTVKPLPPNVVAPFNSYDDMYLQKVAYPDLARLAELAGNNFTFFLYQGPVPGGEDYYFAFWDPFTGHYAYIATDIFRLAPMNISTPWFTAHGIVYDRLTAVWYNYTYFPLWNPVMFADTWNDARKAYSFTRNMTIVKDGKNYTVTVNCTVTYGMAYGSIGEKVEVVDPGETEVNGTTLRPQVKIEMRRYYYWDGDAWRNFTRGTFNVWFNQSARVFNNTIIERNSIRVTLEKQNDTIKKMTVEKVMLGIGIPQITFENPHFSWLAPPMAPKVVVTATYCGRVVRAARVKLSVSEKQFASYPVRPETILMLNYDPIAAPFAGDTPLTVDFKEQAKNFLWGVYPFIFMLGIMYTLGFFAINALSGFLGGPSIGKRYLFGKFQQPYWDLVVARLGDVVLLLAGRSMPGVPWLGEKYAPLVARMREELKQIEQQMPLRRVEDRVKEALKSTVTWRNVARLEDFARSRVERLVRRQAERAAAGARDPVERALLTVELENLARRLVEASYRYKPLIALRLGLEIAWDALLSRNRHTVDALLEAAIHVLRKEAVRVAQRSGIPAYLHPTASRLLKVSDYLEWVRLLQNQNMVYHRALLHAGLALAMRPRPLLSGAAEARIYQVHAALASFHTEYAMLTAIAELSAGGYAQRARELRERYDEVWSESLRARDPLEVLRRHEPLFREARALIQEALGRELLRAGLTLELAKEIRELVHKRDAYVASMGTRWEEMRLGEYSAAALSLAGRLEATGSPLLARYADLLRQDVKALEDIRSEEARRAFEEMADAWIRASASARGEIAKMLGEVDPRFRELWRSGGEPLKFSEAFDRLVDSLEPGVREPLKSFVEKVEEYIYLRAIGADQKDLERVKQELLDSYRATLLAMGLRAELYKLDLAGLERQADALSEVVAGYFAALGRLAEAALAPSRERAEEALREAELIRAVSLVDQLRARGGQLSPEELRGRASGLTGAAREFVEGALAFFEGRRLDDVPTRAGRAGWLYLAIDRIPEALRSAGLDLGGVDWGKFYAGVEDYVGMALRGERVDVKEVGARATEELDKRDYWAGLGYVAMLVEYGEREANQWISQIYPSARGAEAEAYYRAQRELAEAEGVASAIDYAWRGCMRVAEGLAGVEERLKPLGLGSGGFAEKTAEREVLEGALEELYVLRGKALSLERAVNAVREQACRCGLGDEAERVLRAVHQLRDAIDEMIRGITRALGEMDEEGA
jgi:hypothetical protein